MPPTMQLIADFLNAIVRPLSALIMVLAVVYFTAIGLLTADAFLGVAAVILGVYFQGRQQEKTEQRLVEQNKEMVELAKATPPLKGE